MSDGTARNNCNSGRLRPSICFAELHRKGVNDFVKDVNVIEELIGLVGESSSSSSSSADKDKDESMRLFLPNKGSSAAAPAVAAAPAAAANNTTVRCFVADTDAWDILAVHLDTRR